MGEREDRRMVCLWGVGVREVGREGERERERGSTCKPSAPEFACDAVDAG